MLKIKNLRDMAFLLVVIILFESIIWTGIRLFSIGGISSKMLVSAMLVIVTIPFFAYNRRYISSQFSKYLLFFMVIIGINFVRAVIMNQSMSLAIHFIKPFIYLVYYPILIYCINSERKVVAVRNVIMVLGTGLSIFNIGLALIWRLNGTLFWNIGNSLYQAGIINVIANTGSVPRVLFSGVVAQLCACFLCIACFQVSRKRRFVFYSLINILGLFLTYTRGIYFGLVVGVVVFIVKSKRQDGFLKRNFRKLLRVSILLLIIVLIAVIASGGSNIFRYSIQRIFAIDLFSSFRSSGLFSGYDFSVDNESNTIRATSLEQLYELIWRNPVFGNGLGAGINFRGGLVEMLYHDMIAKIGILGLVIFMMPLFELLRRKPVLNASLELEATKLALLSSVVAMFASSFTNPYSMSALGIVIYCFCLRLYSDTEFPIKK